MSQPNVRYKSNTRNKSLLVFLVSQTFALNLAAGGGKCLRRNTSDLYFRVAANAHVLVFRVTSWRRTVGLRRQIQPLKPEIINGA